MDLLGSKDFSKSKRKSTHRKSQHHKGAYYAHIQQLEPKSNPQGQLHACQKEQVSSSSEDENGLPCRKLGADGQVLPCSQGLDLEEMLAEVQLSHNEAGHRYRGMLQEDLDSVLPELDSDIAAQALALDLKALASSLESLPLQELLGLPDAHAKMLALDTEQLQLKAAEREKLPLPIPFWKREQCKEPQTMPPAVVMPGRLSQPQAQQPLMQKPVQPVVTSLPPAAQSVPPVPQTCAATAIPQMPIVHQLQKPRQPHAAPHLQPLQQQPHDDELNELLGLTSGDQHQTPQPALTAQAWHHPPKPGTSTGTSLHLQPPFPLPMASSRQAIAPMPSLAQTPLNASGRAVHTTTTHAPQQPYQPQPPQQHMSHHDDELDELLGLKNKQPPSQSIQAKPAPPSRVKPDIDESERSLEQLLGLS